MGTLRRLAPLLVAVAVTMAGLALGAQLQKENALPSDAETQQMSNRRAATGNVILLTSLVVAGGATASAASLARVPSGIRALPLAAVFSGSYLVANLVQTAWPYYTAVQFGSVRRAVLEVNLLASDGAALPSVLVPIFALWAAAVLLVFWGLRRLLANERPLDLAALLRRQAGTTLVAAPFLGLAAWGCLRLMVALPPVPGASAYRVLLSLATLGFLGLLVAVAAKTWQLMRAARDQRLSPIALEAWEGLGRVEVGLAGLLVLLAAAAFLLPAFPPDSPHCYPIDTSSRVPCPLTDPNVQYHDEMQDLGGLLQSGATFGTGVLHAHLALLLLALLPLAALPRLHKQGVHLLDKGHANIPVPRLWTPTFASGLAFSVALGGLATWLSAGTLLAWVASSIPVAAAARTLAGPVRQAQATLVCAWAAWCLGNSLAAVYDAQQSGLLQFTTNPSSSALWRLLGALLAAWAVLGLMRHVAARVPASTAIPLAGGAAVATLAVVLIELPLDIWTATWTDFGTGTAHASSVYVGTWISRLDLAAAIAVHAMSFAMALGAAAMAARLLRPEWFRRGREPAALPSAKEPARALPSA